MPAEGILEILNGCYIIIYPILIRVNELLT